MKPISVLVALVAVGAHLVAAGSAASVSSAASYASAGLAPQVFAHSAAQRPAAPLDQLARLEASASTSADCRQWAELNARFVQSVGHQSRPGQEYQMERRCEAIERVDNFRRLALAERDQLEFVGNLMAEYVELRRALDSGDSLLAHALERALEQEPQLPAAIGDLQSFGEFLVSKMGGVGGEQKPATDRLAQVDATLRRLVDREPELSDAEFRQLVVSTGQLERALAEVPVHSGRFRYLSGTLDAARAVIVHKLHVGEQDDDDDDDESGPEIAQVNPQVDYVHASAFDGHEPLKVTATAAATAAGQTMASVELPRAPKELLYNLVGQQQQQQQQRASSLPQTIPASLPQQTRKRQRSTMGERLRQRKFADFD